MIIKPMLAASVEDLSAIPYPVLSSPKLDGIRCIVVDGVVVSRTLKPIPNKHIQERWGHEYYNGLDGELIVGSTMDNDTFNTTTSVVMSRNKDPSEYGGVVFSVFDYYLSPDKDYEDRYNDMIDIVDGNDLAAVPFEYAHSEEELIENHSFYLRLGYEGTMVRTVDSKYKYGRSTLKQGWLLKIKDFSDAEGVVIGITELMHNTNEAIVNELGYTERSTKKEGKVGSGMMGTLVLNTKFNGKDVVLEVGTGFTQKMRKEIWDNQGDWIGKIVKYKYQAHGSMDKPRLPVYIGVRWDEDM